ncbi:MAG: DUF1778 domain-containing protein [Desulfobulbaceae bacterium]|jgi:uncharacterized protein (DUF1778 family)|nr:DUF1778 domain-containing protein [Desulfobulbaceae bacterium]
MPEIERRTSPINLRCFQRQKILIDRGAAAQHKSRTDFMLEVACREAENILLDQRLFSLDEKQFAAFEKAIAQPSADPAKLQRLRDVVAPWDK